MAKRRAAEPLAFHVPWKRLLPCDRLDDPEPLPPPPWVPPGLGPRLSVNGSELRRKRKREDGTMAEPLASPSKRSGDAAGSDGTAPGDGTRMDTGEPKPPAEPRGSAEEEPGSRPLLHPRASESERGAGEDAPRPRDARPQEEELIEEFWQYNTFQYWRNPLPSIDLSEIEKLSEATLASKDEGVEIDMES
ncbi:uncharacterized protein C9orf40 homolog [Monodelphis domestica]|uniref:Chromosome 6 open reading frame, human C9orf40 n=1 Tax=Monodelphis domestica TaxID=13616 RepID=F6RHW2_MONDO|nr:uncharacterized protein C9orf40 homolog [Monodelphis domestica]